MNLVEHPEGDPHIIREFDVKKVRDLNVGQIFYCDFDNFVFFFSTNKRYVEKFEDDKAIVQCLHKNEDGSMGFNVKMAWGLDEPAYVLTGEHISIWKKTEPKKES